MVLSETQKAFGAELVRLTALKLGLSEEKLIQIMDDTKCYDMFRCLFDPMHTKSSNDYAYWVNTELYITYRRWGVEE